LQSESEDSGWGGELHFWKREVCFNYLRTKAEIMEMGRGKAGKLWLGK